MKEHSVERLVLPLNFILTCGAVLATFLRLDGIASLFFAATYAFLALGIVAQAINQGVLSPRLICTVICALFCLLHTLISIARYGGEVSMSSLATFLLTLVFFCFAMDMPQCNRLVHLTVGIGSSVTLLFLLAYPFLEKTYIGHGLTFGFSNPNITGMFLLHAVLYVGLAIFYAKRWIARIPLILLAAGGIYMILLTRCRSALVGLAVFAVLAAWFLLKRSRLVPPWLCATIIILPLIFAVLYLLANDAGLLEAFGIWEEEGKNTDSRVKVWEKSFAIIREHLFTGDYAILYNAENGIKQRHNLHVEVLTAYGLIPFILFVIILLLCVLPIGEQAHTPKKQLPLLAFFAVIVAGTFEASFITGALGLYVLSGGFLACAVMAEDEVKAV